MRRSVLVFVSLMLLAGLGRGQPRARLSDEVREFVKIDAAIVVLNHVRVINGTGTAPRPDQAHRDRGWKNRYDRRLRGGENTRSS